ncbi:AAA family ATPase [Burkholderia sp. AU45274]|uniref:AAA family ATPase n=1 Tax=Burkholderia sp. AU45274 TaxID=3059205 RepID=UPI0026550DCB|nr:AAA family ATPase [Burkholderia sp. AU45274]MDN7488458.1 AAA family ATPase [Burkholderia sp. AU45274]
MRRLLSISAKNFKSLHEVNVQLQDLSVLVGPNGAGKTNLLRVIEFLGDTARLDLVPAISRHGGFDNVRFRGAPLKRGGAHRVTLTVEAMVTQYASEQAPDKYTLSFWEAAVRMRRHSKNGESDTVRYTAREEEFVFKRTSGRGRRITVSGESVAINEFMKGDGSESKKLAMSKQSAALSTLRRLSPKEGATQVGQVAALFESFRVFEVDVSEARKPQPVSISDDHALESDRVVLASNASNVATFLAYLDKQHREIFEAIERDLSRVSPNIKRLIVKEKGLGSSEGTVIEIEERGLPGTTPFSEASFGTVRAVALLAMLHDPDPPMLTCVEEIDHGLHPHALDIIVERMRAASSRTQLLVATHSPALVNRLKPSELIVCERDLENGGSLIPVIDSRDVAEMVEQTDLLPGELWFSGALGGGLS